MNSRTLLLVLGAFALGIGSTILIMSPKEDSKPLENNSDKDAQQQARTDKPQTAPKDKDAAAKATIKEMDELKRKNGPSWSMPDPHPEDLSLMQAQKQPEPKSFKELTPEQSALLNDALAQLQSSQLPADKALQVLELARKNYGRQILDIAKAALQHQDAGVRRRALQLLERNGDPGVLEVAKLAVADPDATVRLQSVLSLKGQNGPQVAEIYRSLLKDTDENVVMGMLDSTASLPPGTAAPILNEALKTSAKDPALYAINTLASMNNKEALEAMFDGLDSSDPEIKVNAEHFIFMATQAEGNFKSAAEARAWWDAHHHEFDDELAPIIDGQPNEAVPMPIPQ
jgi:hypothetical protein